MDQLLINFLLWIGFISGLCILIGKKEKEPTDYVKHLKGEKNGRNGRK